MATTAETGDVLTIINVADVEVCPFASYGEGESFLTAGFEGLPKPWQDVLWALHDNPDQSQCAGCGDAVGFVLHGDESWTRWVSTFLAAEGDGPVVALCQPCAPFVPTKGEFAKNTTVVGSER